VYIGENTVGIHTEADSNDITKYPHDDKPSTGMFVIFYAHDILTRNWYQKTNTRKRIGRVSYFIYVSMRNYVLTTSGDIVVCFHTAVCLSCLFVNYVMAFSICY